MLYLSTRQRCSRPSRERPIECDFNAFFTRLSFFFFLIFPLGDKATPFGNLLFKDLSTITGTYHDRVSYEHFRFLSLWRHKWLDAKNARGNVAAPQDMCNAQFDLILYLRRICCGGKKPYVCTGFLCRKRVYL